DVTLLDNGYGVVHAPVQYQTGREEEHHAAKHQWHDHHDACLHGVGWRRVQLDLQEHGGHHEGRQDESGIAHGELLNPEYPRCAPHLDTAQQNPVQGNEYRNLHQHGQTATQRIDFFCPVHFHHGGVHLGLVIAEFLFQGLHARGHVLHFGHGSVA